jgi:class 3 adenylate cyclase
MRCSFLYDVRRFRHATIGIIIVILLITSVNTFLSKENNLSIMHLNPSKIEQHGNDLVIETKLPLGNWNDPVLYIDYVWDVVEIYVGDSLIYQFGDPSSERFPGIPLHIIKINPELYGKTLSIRIFSKYEPAAGSLQVGSNRDILFQMIKTDFARNLFILVFCFIGIVSLLVFYRIRDEISAFYLSLMSFSGAGMLFYFTTTRNLMIENLIFTEVMFVFSNFLIGYSALRFFSIIFKGYEGIFRWLSRIFIVLAIIYAYLKLTWSPFFSAFLSFFHLFELSGLILVGMISLYLFRTRKIGPEARILIHGLIVFIFFTGLDLLLPLLIQWKSAYFEWGLLYFIISFAIIVLNRAINRIKSYADELKRKNDELSKVNEAASRFVPVQFITSLEKSNLIDVNPGDHRLKEMTILFSDIRSFTTLSEKMSPHDNFKFLNAYLSRMEPIIQQHRGFIDKYIGDAVMALFDQGADDALKASITMLGILQEYNQSRIETSYLPINIGIGLNTDKVILGIVGGGQRVEGTVIGDAVNICSRLEGLNKLYGTSLLITDKTYNKLKNPEGYLIRPIDWVQMKGKTESLLIYEVFQNDPPEIQEAKLLTKPLFTKIMNMLEQKNSEAARSLLVKCMDMYPEDSVSRIHMERIRKNEKV